MADIVLRNRIPDLLKHRNLTISWLQRRTQLSYPTTHRISTLPTVTDNTRVGTLRKVAAALEVSLDQLVTIDVVEK